jgi:uncharacterized phage protein (TIGR01671 family)
MREIKFRGLHNGEWVYGSYTHVTDIENGKPSIIPFGTNIFVDVDPESVGQFTGICDNSTPPKEIYEGDIVQKHDDRIHFTYKGKVVFDVLTIDDAFDFTFDIMCWQAVGDPIDSSFKVIGNIYENPNPLESSP